MRCDDKRSPEGGERRSRNLSRSLTVLLMFVSLASLLPFMPVSLATPSYTGREVVLGPGPMGAWDQAGVMQPSVLVEGGLYKMWYVGTDGLSTGIGYYTSLDGRHWNRVVNDALNVSGSGWSGAILSPSILSRPAGVYWMYFSRNMSGGAIGRAVSSGGIIWTNASIVLESGGAQTWDAGGVGEPTVVYHQSKYWMWYVGIDGSGRNASIGLATSADGLTWTKSASNPLIRPATGGWNQAGLASPGAAVLEDGTFALWFAGCDGLSYKIGFAISSDGTVWSKPEMILGNGPPATADGSQARDPSPSPLGSGQLWYSGSDGATWRILKVAEAAPSPPSSIANPATATLAVTLGFVGVGAAAFFRSDRFKYAIFGIPFIFEHIRRRKLDSFVRGQIYQYIRQNLGATYSEIMAGTGATNGNLAYHLHSLEAEGFTKSVKDGRMVHFYLKDVPIPQTHGVRFSSLQARMLETIARNPGMRQVDLSKALDTSKQTIAYNVWHLSDAGIIVTEKTGRHSYLTIAEHFEVKKEIP